jgi:hypothetical protein
VKPGDLVRNTNDPSGKWGLYMGLRTFKNQQGGKDYTCAEVMWVDRNAPNGDRISTVQTTLLEVINEAR